MKARHIRKLRKQVQSFQTFRIKTSIGNFDSFFEVKEWEYKKIKAKNCIHAIERYMK